MILLSAARLRPVHSFFFPLCKTLLHQLIAAPLIVKAKALFCSERIKFNWSDFSAVHARKCLAKDDNNKMCKLIRRLDTII